MWVVLFANLPGALMSRLSNWLDYMASLQSEDNRNHPYDDELIQDDPYILQLEQLVHRTKPQEHSHEYDIFV